MTEPDDVPYLCKHFTITSVAEPIPWMRQGNCVQNSLLLSHQIPALQFERGVLVFYENGEPTEWLEHAWNAAPDGQIDSTVRPQPQGVQSRYIAEGKEPELYAQLAAVLGPPVPFDDDPASVQLADDALLRVAPGAFEPADPSAP
jgi:hypothetical protein